MSLQDQLTARIHATGPMTLGEYMSECLLNPEFGYYATRDPLGAAGDFITAPEISQMFGELIGLALAQSWIDQGAPKSFTLGELGPGRGTLMADALRATHAVPGFHDALQLHLVEASPVLQAAQAEALADFAPSFLADARDLPDAPLFLVANEFFDALPIRQFQRDGDGWRERLIALQNRQMGFALGPQAQQPALEYRLEDTKDGDLVELCEPALPIAAEIGRRIETQGGTALIIDYGDWRSLGDTFQALRDHNAVDPLQNPGLADLTAHVDFEALALASPSAHTKLSTQGVFLERLGITQRAQALAAQAGGQALGQIISAHRRLTHPQEMGTVFKAMALYPSHATPPPGFATDDAAP